MERFLSENVKNVQISGIRKFYNKVAKVEGAISLTIGQPDFDIPNEIREEMINALNDGKTGYTANQGIQELRNEITTYLKGQDINYNEDEIAITCGGSEAIMVSLMALLNEGDRVLIPNPAYPAYESCVKLLGGKIVSYTLDENLQPDIDSIKEKIKEYNPKAIIISHPSNPTGITLEENTYRSLCEVIKENEIIAISDEMYSSIVFEDEYYSVAQASEIKDKVIIVGGFSKMFSMTGMRIGYVCATDSLIKKIITAHQYNVSCAPSIAQWGAYRGLKDCMGNVEKMKQSFEERKNYVVSRLEGMGIETTNPKGAFYVFPSIAQFGLSSDEFCERALNEAKVAMIPGTAFGSLGEGYVRISYCYSMDELKEALNRLEAWLEATK